MRVKFWGVRGSTPTPEIQNLSYGGNTPCVEVRCGGEVFILDGGSGVRNLGQALIEEFKSQKLSVHLFLTHFHWDHIQGIPFFLPLYGLNNVMNYYASRELGPLQERLQGQMSRPYFPVSMDVGAHRNFIEIDTKEIRVGNMRVYPFPLHHPQGACGYRIESDQAVIVYATDAEHGDPRLDALKREYCQDADILIYDAQYTPEEYLTHTGWGHSTWCEGIRVVQDAKVKQLILFHHDPWHNDQTMLAIVRRARAQFENTIAAAEGWTAEI